MFSIFLFYFLSFTYFHVFGCFPACMSLHGFFQGGQKMVFILKGLELQ